MTETQEEIKAKETFEPENMFNSESFINSQEEEEIEDIEDFDGVVKTIEKEEEATKEEINEEEIDNESKINFEEEVKNDDEIDIEKFNKQFNTNFKKQEDLKDFINSKEKEKETNEEDKKLEEADNTISFIEPFLKTNAQGDYLVNDETLMRKQFEAIALQKGKDLNNSDVIDQIETELADLINSGVLKYEARELRRTLDSNLKEAKQSKSTIVETRQNREKEEIKSFNESVQKEFLAFHANENFYGVKPSKEKILEAYRNVASGKFLKELGNNRKLIAELALIDVFKEEIFKKSTGLTYNDGMKAIIDEFKSGNKKNPIVSAQKRGTLGDKDKSQKGLIDSVLYTKPVEEKK